ncbi:extracellular solute-binding protein [Halorussus litoreus]|uniref:extracellular solute-binding protein n=1 Tax=Halorussus litoreus TaxID=1710536 RepID=UPI000E247D7D|nr:extracellular solute-binding protein [Halorussus litoreus]
MRDTKLTRRKLLAGSATAVGASAAGCIGDLTGGSGDDGGDGEEYDVGYGEFETTVNSSTFPTEEKLYIYCVQSGWMNWPSVMEAFDENYGVQLNDDDRSSGEALQDARSVAQNPTHSGFNGGYTYNIQAQKDGLTQAYKPANWDKVPDDAKTEDGHVTGTRKVTTALTYRKDIYEERGLDEPETWEDLLHPDIMQDLALQTPQAAVGLAAALSVNNARGGSLDDVQPVIDYYNEIQEGGAEYTDNFLAQFTRGEYASFVRYDYSGLDLKYNNDDVPEENVGVALLGGENGNKGAFNALYGYALLADAPNPEAAKLFMDYVLSIEGQQHFLDAYARPIRASEMDMPDEFPDQSRYDETEFTVDQQELIDKQEDIIQEITRGAGL